MAAESNGPASRSQPNEKPDDGKFNLCRKGDVKNQICWIWFYLILAVLIAIMSTVIAIVALAKVHRLENEKFLAESGPQSEMGKQLGKLDHRLHIVEAKVDDNENVAQDLTNLQNDIKENNANITELREEFGQQQLEQSEQKTNSSTDMRDLKRHVKEHTDQLAVHQGLITALTDSTNAVSGSMTSMFSRYATQISEAVVELGELGSEVRTGFAAQDARLQALEAVQNNTL